MNGLLDDSDDDGLDDLEADMDNLQMPTYTGSNNLKP
jgi:hypothetical protein